MSDKEYNSMNRSWWLTILLWAAAIVLLFFAIRSGDAWLLGAAVLATLTGGYSYRQFGKVFTLK